MLFPLTTMGLSTPAAAQRLKQELRLSDLNDVDELYSPSRARLSFPSWLENMQWRYEHSAIPTLIYHWSNEAARPSAALRRRTP